MNREGRKRLGPRCWGCRAQVLCHGARGAPTGHKDTQGSLHPALVVCARSARVLQKLFSTWALPHLPLPLPPSLLPSWWPPGWPRMLSCPQLGCECAVQE